MLHTRSNVTTQRGGNWTWARTLEIRTKRCIEIINIGIIRLRLKIKTCIYTLKEIKPSTTGQSTRNNKKGLKHIEEKIFIEFIAVNNIII